LPFWNKRDKNNRYKKNIFCFEIINIYFKIILIINLFYIFIFFLSSTTYFCLCCLYLFYPKIKNKNISPYPFVKKQLEWKWKFHCHIYLLQLSYLPLLIFKLECKMEASFPHLPTSAIICLKTTILKFFLKNQYFSKILFKHKNKHFIK
jgi:hypothetical protein